VSTIQSRLVFVCFALAGVSLGAWAGAPDVCDGVSPVDTELLSRVTVATGLSQPLYVTAPPGDTSRIFIVEQPGRIRELDRGAATNGYTTYLDLSSRITAVGNEQGLLGLAFDPDFAANRFFYVNYTTNGVTPPCPGATSGDTIVARFEEVGGVGSLASERCILSVDQPEANHNGGEILFGPDENLYVFTGDGGGGGDAHGACGNGQATNTLLGKILRIAPVVPQRPVAPGASDCGAGIYRIPAGNPFSGPGGDCDEIWAWGRRNPWRNDFDSATGDLYVADVGQECWEEFNWIPADTGAGRNYGWRQMEGNHCFNPATPFTCNPAPAACGFSPACNDPSLTDPVLEVAQTTGACSGTGGNVYRGCRMSAHQGKYFYSDFCAGFVRSFEISGGVATNVQDWSAAVGSGLPFTMTSFGKDAQNEVYLVSRSGAIHRLAPPFPTVEVSGPGAQTFRVERDVDWSWEDVHITNWLPIQTYRVYRGVPAGTFTCIHATATPSWTGDPETPDPGQLFAYLVTAISGGLQSSTGEPERTLSPDPCPAQ
jgi:glucose/arabinose dehydrogenase